MQLHVLQQLHLGGEVMQYSHLILRNIQLKFNVGFLLNNDDVYSVNRPALQFLLLTSYIEGTGGTPASCLGHSCLWEITMSSLVFECRLSCSNCFQLKSCLSGLSSIGERPSSILSSWNVGKQTDWIEKGHNQKMYSYGAMVLYWLWTQHLLWQPQV